jgi:hypothetical protein
MQSESHRTRAILDSNEAAAMVGSGLSASVMNTNQKLVRLAGIALLIGMALIPPWQFSSRQNESGKQTARSVGYYTLWNPPREEVESGEGETNLSYRINLIRLGVQFAAVLVVMNGGIYLLRAQARN